MIEREEVGGNSGLVKYGPGGQRTKGGVQRSRGQEQGLARVKSEAEVGKS